MPTVQELLDTAYEHPETIPWDTPIPPQELVGLVTSNTILPCKTLDIACGTGHFSIYLAKQGFEVTGFDISQNAIDLANKRAKEAALNIKFMALEAIDIAQINDTFDFAFEWGLLHFVMPEFREKYVKDLASRLNPGAFYVVLTFNDQSPEWGGGKYRTGITKTPLYYSSIDELVELYSPYFTVLESKVRPTFFANSGNTHLENYLLLQRNH